MRALRNNALGLLVVLVALLACSHAEPERHAPAPAATLQARDGEDAAKTDPAKLDAETREAARAFAAARYADAVTLLRSLITQAPGNQALWSLYDRALLAQKGDAYLRDLPPNRYRVEIPDFVQNGAIVGPHYFILDVREPREFDQGHFAGAVNIPLRQLLQHLDLLPEPASGRLLLVVCNTQHRANHAIVLLRELGFANAHTLQGGYQAYLEWLKQNHLPANRLRKTRDLGPPAKVPVGDGEREEDFGC